MRPRRGVEWRPTSAALADPRSRQVGRHSAPGRCLKATATLWIPSLLAFLSSACGPRVAPAGPGPQPEGGEAASASVRATATGKPAREIVVGEMCPRAADGRPAVKPLFVRSLTWSADSQDASAPVERRAVRQFSVLAWDGRRAGRFSVAGLAEVGEQDIAAGAYAGSSPCERPREAGDAGSYPECVSAQAECGVAVGLLERGSLDEQPFEEDAAPLDLDVGGACIADDTLLVDIDGDGVPEAYAIADFVNPVRAPAEEVFIAQRGSETCAPAFAIHHAVPPADPKHWRGLDLLGVVDLDGDGRRELLFSYHYAIRRTWAVYSATGSVARLDLVGEAEPWVTR